MLGDTPMMTQYNNIKSLHEDCILLYRLGDFYEMFGQDAEVAAKILDIALTSREAGKGNKIPMCGVPHHAADNYIAKLIHNGLKVAICEQVEDPRECKGIVKREVVRIITPGTVLEQSILNEKANNFLLSVVHNQGIYGLAAVDVSTGDFFATEVSDGQSLINDIYRYDPAECIISPKDSITEQLLKKIDNLFLNKHLDYAYISDYSHKLLLEHFRINSLQSIGLADFPTAACAAGAILDYLLINQKIKPANLIKLNIYHLHEKMFLDLATKRNLELTQSLHNFEKKDSLLGVIDNTETSLGSRMLKAWVEQPLICEKQILERLDSTEVFVNNSTFRKNIKKILSGVYDLERITGRISFGSANAKDLLALKYSINLFPLLKEELMKSNNYEPLAELIDNFDTLEDISSLLTGSLAEEPPFSLREGSLIKDGYHTEVDDLRSVTRNGKQWILDLELSEKERTGIKSLKIGFNKVFGYYLEITKSNLHLVPDNYYRKQTLANGERFITPELKELELQVIGADERLKELEYQLFVEIREKIKEYIPRILQTGKIIAQIDCLVSLAEAAVINSYVKPTINNEGIFNISKCRHPVVEKKLSGQWFIPNDIYMDFSQRFLIITGPNMAGKSTFCRSIALTSILMQIGSFVPAQKAELPIVDRVFARIGASDDLSTGQSTFMVEMNEVANIVNNATENSLIILDEVGRGTSTYDGLSIAWSLTEFINNKLRSKTLFATHYHELTKLENALEGIKNFSIAVKEEGDHIVFLHKIIQGGADRSYGIQVAKLAGLPEEIILKAKEILKSLENGTTKTSLKTLPNDNHGVITTIKVGSEYESDLVDRLLNLDLLNITPIQAINTLYDLQHQAKISFKKTT
ncbi:MAG: DNA mismatch repair protein MutS [Bacillota bacterium]